MFGTGVLGGIAAYPFALLFMNKSASEVAVYTYIVPFLVSTAGGAIIAGVVLYTLKGAGALDKLRAMLNR